MEQGTPLCFHPVVSFYLPSSFFLALSQRPHIGVYHTSTHGVALVWTGL